MLLFQEYIFTCTSQHIYEKINQLLEAWR